MIDFGTGGFRGVIGETFTKENIQIITQGIANIIKKRKSTTPLLWVMIIALCQCKLPLGWQKF